MPADNNRNVEKFRKALDTVFRNGELSDAALTELASQLVAASVTQRKSTQRELLTVRHLEGQPPNVMHYNPAAVIRLIAHAIEAVADPSNYVLIGAAALLCGSALKEFCHTVTPSEAVLLCSLYFSDGGRADRDTAIKLFNDSCETYSEIKSEDFVSALQSLLSSNFVVEENGSLRVAERVRILNVAPVFDNRHA